MKLHEKLGTLRKDKGLSQEGLAEKLGLSRQAVAKWENGETLPEIENLVAIGKYFMVSIDSLVKDEENCSPPLHPPLVENRTVVEFLCRAKRATYAGKGRETDSSRRNSHDLDYREDTLSYLDSFLGSERFSGEEAVWTSEVPIWALNYTGRTLSDRFSGDFLKEALLSVASEMPYRGPQIFKKGEYSYHCWVNGSFDWFDGREEIFAGHEKTYECLFHGGAVK